MIQVKVRETNNKVKSVSVKGHAMYSEYGKDIVCSAVSTCVITSINGILELDNNSLDVIEKENEIMITLKNDSDVAEKLIKNMLEMLNDIEVQYPKNIRLSKEEM